MTERKERFFVQVGSYTVKKFEIAGPLHILTKCFGDDRGFFTERFRTSDFSQMGLPTFVQENYSRSQAKVLRGLHFQYDRPQGKLITITRGKVLDVAVDIRTGSPTFGKSLSVVLDGAEPSWFWLPPGFAHGFSVISPEGADVMYKVDNLYNAAGEGAIRWNDSELGINWQLNDKEPILSAKDTAGPSFADYKLAPRF
jgi:dTDP-4-dehydrorhamnose 3,5-epimerase